MVAALAVLAGELWSLLPALDEGFGVGYSVDSFFCGLLNGVEMTSFLEVLEKELNGSSLWSSSVWANRGDDGGNCVAICCLSGSSSLLQTGRLVILKTRLLL